jgi:transcriptional regulator with GAF, ATPase, and Fis domain
VNCSAIPEALLEAEPFGYTKGSFTGAVQSRIGRIHAAHGGTLFLDEIGDMPLSLQGKILRFLEQGEVQRLGGNDNLKVDVRVVAATNADLKSMVAKQQFREDLYYRLAVFPIHLPPLRERMEDLDELAVTFNIPISRSCQAICRGVGRATARPDSCASPANSGNPPAAKSCLAPKPVTARAGTVLKSSRRFIET